MKKLYIDVMVLGGRNSTAASSILTIHYSSSILMT